MSFDFSLEKRCSHEVIFEHSIVDQNNGFVLFARQPANQASVSLYVDGVSVPSFGLYSFAELPFGRAEPYRIHAGVNDLLYIGVGNEIARFVQLLTGSNIRADELARDLQKKIPALLVTVINGHVVFRSRTPFKGAAFQFPDPRWIDRTSSSSYTARSLAAFKYFGIVPGRVVSGRKIFPGWSLEQDPTSPILTDKCILFDSPLPNSEPLIQTSYITVAANCRRCFGSRIEFDYDIVNGTYDIVQQTDLIAQEFDKFLFTRLGSHWKWTWLGSNLMSHIGGKSNSTRSSAPALISIDVTQAYKVYQNIKQQQEQRFPSQKVSDAEMPTSLDSVNVTLSPDDPTVAIVSITVRNRSRVPIPLKRLVGTPGPFLISDTTGAAPLLPRG